ncbi:TPA: hypothetical protein DCW61_04485 [Candidatus Uhrbacteria bacterium]|nr:hypothetical protein [Candidatus Uhrbacteria bacterium]
MDPQTLPFITTLSILWFLVYWILGGVFFAIVTVVRLGRIRKVRFSCLFSILSLVLGIGTAYLGMEHSKEAINACLAEAITKAETVAAIFGCGFAGIFGTFLLGALVLTFSGFIILALSKSKTKPWIVLDSQEETLSSETSKEDDSKRKSKFF